MCGIVGAIAQRDVIKILIAGLKRLEYRGYDSAGVAVINDQAIIERRRAMGKVAMLEELLQQDPIRGKTGIAHTRWATHGKPAENNAHPHMSSNKIVLVHNGIIENHEELRAELQKKGYQFTSETDSEVIAHLIYDEYKKTQKILLAVKNAVDQLTGAYALGILCSDHPDHLIAVRHGSPLVIGLGIGENFIASDSLALLQLTQQFIYLDEGDIADIQLESVKVFDANLQPVERKVHLSQLTNEASDKGEFRHFMLKEIYEQPKAILETLEGRLSNQKVFDEIFGLGAKEVFKKVERIQIVACGTSYHAGMVARYWLEELAGIPCQVEIASEIRYRQAVISQNTLFVSISQSGETADTLAALRQAKTNPNYLATLTICNVPESSLVRESDLVFMTRAGAEVGVASTKAFTTQLVALLLLTILVGHHHQLTAAQEAELVTELNSLPRSIEQALNLNEQIKTLAQFFIDKNHTLFLGRSAEFPIALEGALKLKEISYIHAEAYPAGELKHGPLALVDNQMPVVAMIANDHLIDKVKSNLQEVSARGGQIIAFIDKDVPVSKGDYYEIVTLPKMHPVIAPILFTIPMQLLAYHVAVLKGTDVDQPRNLAKSVTVE